MSIDTFANWIEELGKHEFDISALTWRLLRLAGQYGHVVVKLQTDSTIGIGINNGELQLYNVNHANGTLRMILGRVASFYIERTYGTNQIALYGFEGTIEVDDNFGTRRRLQIEMKNNNRDGCYIVIKTMQSKLEV